MRTNCAARFCHRHRLRLLDIEAISSQTLDGRRTFAREVSIIVVDLLIAFRAEQGRAPPIV